MRETTFWDRIADPFRELRLAIEYHFAKKWLDRNFEHVVGKQEYWGDFLAGKFSDLLTPSR